MEDFENFLENIETRGEEVIPIERVEFIYDLEMRRYGLDGNLFGENSEYFIPGYSYVAKTRWGEHIDTGKPLMIVEIFGTFLTRNGGTFTTNEDQCENGWAIPGTHWDTIRVMNLKWLGIK
jgi:hypothetical protein